MRAAEFVEPGHGSFHGPGYAGQGRWKVYGATRPFPPCRDIEDSGETPAELVADLVLRTGDVLDVPRGVGHVVSADQDTHSLHVTS
ncbi:cupin domain-containing protein [Streptomyces sp. NBC_01334]|nr:cupin domain-containing protein [Streptomyces sp. NBC_01334]